MNKSLQYAIYMAKKDPNGLSDADIEFIYQQGRTDALDDAKLDDGQYCWQECCATEMCGECSKLGNGDINYFDNTFANKGAE